MSDVPNKIFENMREALESRRIILTGGSGDYRFKPVDVLADATKAAAEARAVLNEAINKDGINLADFIASYKTANGICALARDQLAVGAERLQGIVGGLNSAVVDLDAGRLAARIPGYAPAKEG